MHANETHGVPHLHESLVPEALLAKIDRLTAIDRKIYAWARQRLIPKLCALRLSSNVLGEDAQACEVRSLACGLNVLPWEAPRETAEAVGAFVSSGSSLIT